eukprot:GILJ01012548.1.p1 GENE.GILJ01012548.1~~GILJ01012548.1.p1  ORF type:complete len:254 (-),score=22.25 GILJ01012548.1:44-763(-)
MATLWERIKNKFGLCYAASYLVCCKCICFKKTAELEQHEPTFPCKILVVGLNGAGKSTFLRQLDILKGSLPANAAFDDIQPTSGFNIVNHAHKRWDFSFWEIGGNDKIRKYWDRYANDAHGIVLMVDGSSADSFSEAFVAFSHLLQSLKQSNPSHSLPLFLLVNKTDIPSCATSTDVAAALQASIDKRLLSYHTLSTGECNALSAESVVSSLDMISHQLDAFYRADLVGSATTAQAPDT